MTDQAVLGSLLISVWVHDGVPVARLRGFRRLDAPQEDLGSAVGEEAVVDAVRAWLASVRPREP